MVAELQEHLDEIHPWHQRDVSVQSWLVHLWNKALESSGVCTRKLDCGMCGIGSRVRCTRESLSSVSRQGGGDMLSCTRSCVAFCRWMWSRTGFGWLGWFSRCVVRTLGVVWSARVVRGVSVCLSVVTGQASVKDPSGQPAPAGLRDSKIQIEVRLANSEVKCKVNMSSSSSSYFSRQEP